MPELEIERPNCGVTTGTGLRPSERSFGASTFEGRGVTCESCGEQVVRDDPDVPNT
jgi:hypothetical protein